MNQYTIIRDSHKYERSVYNLTDLIGDIGGVLELLVMFFGVFFSTISYHSFNLSAIKKLFIVKSHEN